MNIKFFKEQNFKDHELVVFCDKLRLQTIEADKYVFKHGNSILFLGDYGDKFYIIMGGKVSILVPKKKEVASKNSKGRPDSREKVVKVVKLASPPGEKAEVEKQPQMMGKKKTQMKINEVLEPAK